MRIDRAGRLLVAAALLCIPTGAALAQQPDRAVYAVMLANDTVALERVTRTPDRLDGELHLISQQLRIAYRAQLLPHGRVASLELRTFGGTDTVGQRLAIEFRGDSAIVRSAGGEQRVATQAGAVPYINLSLAFLEQAVAAARAGGGDSTRVPAFVVGSTSTIPIEVRFLSRDSVTLRVSGVVFHARTSREGHILEASVPAQRVTMRRHEGDREISIARPDYSAPPGAPYTAEDVVVRTRDGLRLAGTLTVPVPRAAGGVPAVVTISGSGPQNRDSEIALVHGYRPFRQIADTLARRGIATLRLDDRGVGGSDLGPMDVTSANFADDIRAAVTFLRARPEIDGRRIGLVGHSEGGVIAPMVASTDSLLRAIVLMAGTASPGGRIIRYQQRYVVDSMLRLSGAPRDSALRAFSLALDSAAVATPWLAFFLEYDPSRVASTVRTPTLILQGETDQQVPQAEAHTLARVMREGGNADVTVRVFEGLNHLFLRDPSGSPGGYGNLASSEVPPEVLGKLADWLVAKLGRR